MIEIRILQALRRVYLSLPATQFHKWFLSKDAEDFVLAALAKGERK